MTGILTFLTCGGIAAVALMLWRAREQMASLVRVPVQSEVGNPRHDPRR